jgi:hypothetical protein
VKAATVPWSWAALVVAGVLLGMLLGVAPILIMPFRQGLDADGFPRMMQARMADLVFAIGLLGLLGLPFLVLGRWLANRSARARRNFLFLTPVTPTALMFLRQAWYIVSAAMEPPMNIMPFPANSWTYLPNWLELAAIATAFLIAASGYLRVAQAVAGPMRSQAVSPKTLT